MAFSSYKSSFNTLYGTAGTKLDTCDTCHTPTGTSTWNPYGLDVKSQLQSGAAIDAALKNVETLDSDKDTFSNIVEINAERSLETLLTIQLQHPRQPRYQ